VREQGSTTIPLVTGGAGLLFVTFAGAVAIWNALVKRRSLQLYPPVALALATFVDQTAVIRPRAITRVCSNGGSRSKRRRAAAAIADLARWHCSDLIQLRAGRSIEK
jgi:hypothetical protein